MIFVKSITLSALVHSGLPEMCHGIHMRRQALEEPPETTARRKLACNRTTALLYSNEYINDDGNPWIAKFTGPEATTYNHQETNGNVAVYTWDQTRGERKSRQAFRQYGDYWTRLQGDGNFITYRGDPEDTSDLVWKSDKTDGEGTYFLGVKCDDTVAIYKGTADKIEGGPLWICPSAGPTPTPAPTPLPEPTVIWAFLYPDGQPLAGPTGAVRFTYPTDLGTGYTLVEYNIGGLSVGLHGFHVHTNAVNAAGQCLSAGIHWNPGNENHGSNLDEQRHVGDMGNILANGDGVASGTLLAALQPLSGKNGIGGHSVVVHSGEDDLGLGGTDVSRVNGDAGNRIYGGTLVEGPSPF